jgi:hypothetical protein
MYSNDWAEYSVFDKPNILIHREDDKKGNRFYWWIHENVINVGIGITSLLQKVCPTSPYLVQWKLDNPNWEHLLFLASEYGTLLHIMCLNWLVHKSVPRELLEQARDICKQGVGSIDMPEKDVLSFIKWCEDYNVKPLIIEGMLISPALSVDSNAHYCQTVDLLCEIDVIDVIEEEIEDGVYQRGEKKGLPKFVTQKTKVISRKIANVDFKSNFLSKEHKSFFETHLYQLIAAKRAVEYNFPDVKVEIIANWSPNAWKTEPTYSYKIWDVTDKIESIFDKYIEIGYLNGYFTPRGNKFIFNEEFTPETKSNSFELLNYYDYIRKNYCPVVEEE